MGIFPASTVALFTEMQGLPPTAYLLAEAYEIALPEAALLQNHASDDHHYTAYYPDEKSRRASEYGYQEEDGLLKIPVQKGREQTRNDIVKNNADNHRRGGGSCQYQENLERSTHFLP